ncbi:DMT family transporter [Novosphingobium sp. Gsoil 351]|uniref:DMT family transporter n=1 Tax=Novosphingobium sp. Gsoil 351 TaxID=2675225 RepID=UPI0012B4C5CD|nr:DMT family transporter [Novosphingobium sp. Gsoil 351]QGN55951.1 EamA family transporter [Novosphingobium sp. Gsoil 351]
MTSPPPPRATPLHFAALLGGNAALALGPWFVRVADTGPVSAAFWRLTLALPAIGLLALANRQRLTGLPWRAIAFVMGGGLFFAADLASWHIGIERTRLGNATLFGNAGSVLLMGFGLIGMRRRPRAGEWAGTAAALAGAAILLGRSLEIGARTLAGDLFCLLAGLLYTFYILALQRARDSLGNWTLLAYASLAGLPLLLGVAMLRHEPFWPHAWWVVIGLALSSQVIGQGLLVYALKHFTPLVVGLTLLTQPVVSVIVGWLAFGETLLPLDVLGMALVGTALVLARIGDAPAARGTRAALSTPE